MHHARASAARREAARHAHRAWRGAGELCQREHVQEFPTLHLYLWRWSSRRRRLVQDVLRYPGREHKLGAVLSWVQRQLGGAWRSAVDALPAGGFLARPAHALAAALRASASPPTLVRRPAVPRSAPPQRPPARARPHGR